ncbi:MAG: 50S ribosome-binding GTPase [Planctomycetes bacterium]|nr:50S ribosome-binding GTPase [Planctomycetota bacterium]
MGGVGVDVSFEFAMLSPVGVAGIGVIGLLGRGARSAAERLIDRPATPGRASHRVLRDRFGEAIDDAVVLPIGIDAFVITVHGNPTICDMVCERLRELGGRDASATELGADLFQPRTEIEREAWSLLASASSPSVVRWLLEQADPRGEGLGGWVRSRARDASAEEIEVLIGRRWGLRIFDPPTVVLSGVPNAGKSTLFNRWVGHCRVVVDATPGTTRDRIEEVVEAAGFPIRLVDTAGIRDAEDSLESEGVRRAREAAELADLVIELIPPLDPFVGDTRDLVPRLTATRALKIRSRFDQIPPAEPGRVVGSSGDSEATEFPPIGVSGLTGEGMTELERRVVERLHGVDRLRADVPVLFTRRQRDLVRRVLDAIRAGGDTRRIWDLLEAGSRAVRNDLATPNPDAERG